MLGVCTCCVVLDCVRSVLIVIMCVVCVVCDCVCICVYVVCCVCCAVVLRVFCLFGLMFDVCGLCCWCRDWLRFAVFGFVVMLCVVCWFCFV